MSRRSYKKRPWPAVLRVGGASEIVAVLKSLGVDPEEVLYESGIHPELFDDPGNVISYGARDRLLKQCVTRTGCQHFGLLVGERMSMNSLGLIGLLMKTSLSVEAALRSLVSYLHLHSQGAVMTLRFDGDLAVLSYDAFDSQLEAIGQVGDAAVAMMLNVMRELCGAEFDAVEASFAHRAPADIRPYRTRFHGRLFFDAEHYAIGFMRSWLDGRPAGADAELQQLLKSQVDALDAKQGLRFPDQVRSVLRTSLLTGHASEAQIAAIFSMPKHTLSRRLESDGTGFRELVDECRFEIARQMLADTSLEVGEIGVALGYSRSSAFIRAFRRWSGTTPSIWRSNRDRGPF